MFKQSVLGSILALILLLSLAACAGATQPQTQEAVQVEQTAGEAKEAAAEVQQQAEVDVEDQRGWSHHKRSSRPKWRQDLSIG